MTIGRLESIQSGNLVWKFDLCRVGTLGFSLVRDWTPPVFEGYCLEMVATVPSNLVKLTMNGSL
jgi:hypothetical protein